MTMKIAGSTGIEPAPIYDTIINVVVLDDCRSTVTNIQTMRDATGFVFPPKRPPAAQPVNALVPVLRSSREKMNQYRKNRMPIMLRPILAHSQGEWMQQEWATSPHDRGSLSSAALLG
jgi:hypothetical protein